MTGTPLKVAPPFEPVIQHLRDVLRGIRTGRATTGLVEPILVDAYGTMTKLRDLASISTPDPRTIQLEPWDTSLVSAIAGALHGASLGASPAVTGKIIRLNLPPLTEERREEIVKLVGKHTEDARITLRTIREKLQRDLKRRHDAHELSDDAWEREKHVLQGQVDDALQVIQELGKKKESEIRESSS